MIRWKVFLTSSGTPNAKLIQGATSEVYTKLISERYTWVRLSKEVHWFSDFEGMIIYCRKFFWKSILFRRLSWSFFVSQKQKRRSKSNTEIALIFRFRRYHSFENQSRFPFLNLFVSKKLKRSAKSYTEIAFICRFRRHNNFWQEISLKINPISTPFLNLCIKKS